MPILYRLNPMQELRDQNYMLARLAHEVCQQYPDTTIVEQIEDKMLINVGGYEMYIFECEFLVDFGDRVVAVTYLDCTSNILGLMLSRNNPNDIVVYGQPANSYPDHAFKAIQGGYIKRWPFINLDTYYHLRQMNPELVDKMIFRGNYGSLPRNTVYTLIEDKYKDVFVGAADLNPHQYFMDIIQHKVGLSIPGSGEFCYRDIEYMACGVPMLRFEYESNLTPPLIPNYHYIAIPRPSGMDYVQERSGCPEYAQMYIDKFLEVKNNKELLQEVSQNARKYYEQYLSDDNRVAHTLTLMEV